MWEEHNPLGAERQPSKTAPTERPVGSAPLFNHLSGLWAEPTDSLLTSGYSLSGEANCHGTGSTRR